MDVKMILIMVGVVNLLVLVRGFTDSKSDGNILFALF